MACAQAPTSHDNSGVPRYLIEKQLAVDTMAVLVLHRLYTDIVRGVADETGAGLLDLERDFNRVERSRNLFTTDGIHFSQTGLREMAIEMYQYLQDITPWEQAKEGIS